MKTLLSLGFFISIYLASSIISPCRAQIFEFRHLARGADTAEIYITCQWYDDDTTSWGAIFHSTDNGKSFSMQSKYIFPDALSEIFGDSLQGVIYQVPYGAGLGVSYNYGVTFGDKYIPITSYMQGIGGCLAGELYFEGDNVSVQAALYHVTHYGDSCQLENTNMDSLITLESGSLPGEVYAILWPYYGVFSDTLGLAFSNDYGQTFTINYLDTAIIANLCQHTLSCGPAPGELYITGYDTSLRYHILHSFDYGHTFELKHIYPFNWNWEEFSFVAGRAPGTFYIFEEQLCSTVPLHNCIEIHFSRDYGATYTTYFHELDSTYTGITESLKLRDSFQVFPNPATGKVRIHFGMRSEEIGMNMELRIIMYNIFGRKVEEIYLPRGKEEVMLDVSGLPEGLYVAVVESGDKIIGREKLVVE